MIKLSKIYLDDQGNAINGFDTVAYFVDKKAVNGKTQFSRKFMNASWLFVNEENLKMFDENPGKYIPQYGGFCSYGISQEGKLYPADPTVWEIVNKKLYLNYNKKYKDLWEENMEGNINTADEIWKKLNEDETIILTPEQRIKSAFEQNEKTLKKIPSLGQKTGKVKITANDGLICDIQSGPWKFKADMSEKSGGTETAPSPGIYEAGALGSCVAIMAKLWGAKLNVPINNIEIEVEFDSDSRVLYAIDHIPARWKAIRYNIKVDSPASENDINKVLDLAHQQSHVRGDFEHSFKVERKVQIINHQEAGVRN